MVEADNTATPSQLINPKDWTKEELRLIEANAMDANIFAARILEQIELAPSFITNEQINLIEEQISCDRSRRAGLLFASMSGTELCEKIKQDREFSVATASILDNLQDAKNRYQQLAELLERVGTRMRIALCIREDMEEVLAEGAQ